jgi:phosphotriesterase-related protein
MLDSGFDMPSDAQRLRSMRWLIDEGYEDRIVIAHDLHTKHRLVYMSHSDLL